MLTSGPPTRPQTTPERTPAAASQVVPSRRRPRSATSRSVVAGVALSLTAVLIAGCSSGSDGAESSASKVSDEREEPERATTTTEDDETTTTDDPDAPADTPTDKSPGKTTTTVAGQAPSPGASDFVLPAGWVEYDSPTGARLAHPAEWTIEENPAAPIVLYIDPATSQFRRNINMLIQPVGAMTLDDYVQLTAGQLTDANATVSAQGATAWSGLPAYEWQYSANLGGTDLAVYSIVTLIDSEAWLMTFTARPGEQADVMAQVATVFSSVVLPG